MLMACYDCGTIFSDSEADIRKDIEIHSETSPTSEEVKYDYRCPKCGSKDITDDVQECELCGEWGYQYFSETCLCDECVEKVNDITERAIKDIAVLKYGGLPMSERDATYVLLDFVEYKSEL